MCKVNLFGWSPCVWKRAFGYWSVVISKILIINNLSIIINRAKGGIEAERAEKARQKEEEKEEHNRNVQGIVIYFNFSIA